MNAQDGDVFFREYTSTDAIRKYTRRTAGYGISHLLDNDYKAVYLEALSHLPAGAKERGLRLLEFGCGGGMNLIHLVALLDREGFRITKAVGTDFSPVLIDAARREAIDYLGKEEQQGLEFYVARNETLLHDLAAASGSQPSQLERSFDFILGVNTIRYSHRSGQQLDCARDLLSLLSPGGICVVIDMNDRFPAFRSALRNKLRGKKETGEECYLPSLQEYTDPFAKAGFEVLRSEHFCWIPHSAGPLLTGALRGLSPLLRTVAPTRAMRSVVVARRPQA